MDKLTYIVKRERDNVFYSIFKGDELVTKREVTWYDLTLIQAVFRCSPNSEKCIAWCLEASHKIAKEAILNMNKHEKLNNQ